MIVLLADLGVLRHALHGEPEVAQIASRDMQNDVAVMKVGGISTAAAKRDRPPSFTRFDAVHFDLRKNQKARRSATFAAKRRALDSRSLAAECVCIFKA